MQVESAEKFCKHTLMHILSKNPAIADARGFF